MRTLIATSALTLGSAAGAVFVGGGLAQADGRQNVVNEGDNQAKCEVDAVRDSQQDGAELRCQLIDGSWRIQIKD